ncbi:MAG: hypothetical protein Q4D58_07455 [Synergistaceae bacterium]|nr:hypothetical protein [Synergistaceae bacterium]
MSESNIEKHVEKISIYLHKNKQKLFINEKVLISNALYKVVKIRQRKEKGNVTYETIANLVNVDKSYIGLLMNGKRHPTKYLWLRIGMLAYHSLDEMQTFMETASYTFNERLIIDNIIIDCLKANININGMMSVFIKLGIEGRIIKEVFGDY